MLLNTTNNKQKRNTESIIYKDRNKYELTGTAKYRNVLRREQFVLRIKLLNSISKIFKNRLTSLFLLPLGY